MKKYFLMLIVVLLSLTAVSSVFAGDYCNIDDYGCWVNDEDGNQMYIMFWSESARKAIMGYESKPGDLVVDRCWECGDQLRLDGPKGTGWNLSLRDRLAAALVTYWADWLQEFYPEGKEYGDFVVTEEFRENLYENYILDEFNSRMDEFDEYQDYDWRADYIKRFSYNGDKDWPAAEVIELDEWGNPTTIRFYFLEEEFGTSWYWTEEDIINYFEAMGWKMEGFRDDEIHTSKWIRNYGEYLVMLEEGRAWAFEQIIKYGRLKPYENVLN